MELPNTTSRPHRRKVIFGAVGALAAGAGLAGGRDAFQAMAHAKGLVVRSRAGVAFGTTVAMTVAGLHAPTLERSLDDAFRAIHAVERASSVYRADSDLSRLNREGRIAIPAPHLVTLLHYASGLSRDTDGAFDVTVQPLWDLWSGTHVRGERPSPADLRKTLARIDWRGVAVTPDLITFDRPGMAVTLNGINQGYAADVVMAAFVSRGIEHAFVDTGEFGARGTHPDGRAWRLGVVSPRDTTRLAFTIDPFRRFAATSGDYETFFSPDLKDHHIFDPRTGYSPRDWSSITVQASSGLEADGLSTALFVLGHERGRALLAARPGSSARYFAKDGSDLSPSA